MIAELRPCREEDLSGVVALMNECDVEEIGEADSSEEDLGADWAETSFDLATDAWVAVDGDGRIVGYADVFLNGPGEVDLGLSTDPGSEERAAIGTALLARALERAVQTPEARLRAWASRSGSNRTLLEEHGFTPIRAFFRMRADLDAAVTHLRAEPPEGIELRAFRKDVDDAALHGALVEAFAAHVRPIPADLATFAERHFAHPSFDPDLWTVAWDGDVVAGGILAVDHGDIAFVPDIGVREPWRGRGLGLALLARTFDLLRARGQRRIDLGVDTTDPGAVRLYERAGFTVFHHSDLMGLG